MGNSPPPKWVKMLARSELFKGLSAQSLERLAAVGTEEAYPKNASIFKQGDMGNKLYLVLSGAVRVSRTVPGMGEEALAVMREGSSIGEMALIEDAPRSADAIAHEQTRLFTLGRADLEDLLFVDRDLAYEFLWKLVRLLSARLRDTTDKMTFLSVAGKFD